MRGAKLGSTRVERGGMCGDWWPQRGLVVVNAGVDPRCSAVTRTKGWLDPFRLFVVDWIGNWAGTESRARLGLL